jgi:hypothetical protein
MQRHKLRCQGIASQQPISGNYLRKVRPHYLKVELTDLRGHERPKIDKWATVFAADPIRWRRI